MADTADAGSAYLDILPRLQGFGSDLRRQLDGQAGEAGRQAGQNMGTQMGSGFSSSIGKLVAGGTIAYGLKQFIGGGLDEIKDSQAVVAQTEATLRSTGAAAKVTAGHVAELSAALGKKAAVDGEVVQAGANMLLTFTNVRNEVGKGNDIFDQATQTALDMARVFGGDASKSAMQLGKALNDPIAGVTALARVGVTFTDQQKEQIRVLQESGDILGAQKIILAELAKEVGGSAEAYGKTLAGSIEKAKIAIGDLEGQVIGGLAPALGIGARAAASAAEAFGAMPSGVQFTVLALGGLAVALPGILAVRTAILSLTASMAATSLAGAAFRTLLVGAFGAVGGVGAVLLTAKVALDAFGVSSSAANKEFAKFVTDMGRLSDQQLTAMAQRIRGLGGEMQDVVRNKMVAGFDELARSAPASAQRVIDAFKAAGLSTADLEAKLKGAIAGTRQLNTDQSQSAAILNSTAGATDNLTRSLDDLAAAQQGALNASLGLTGAHHSARTAAIATVEAQDALSAALAEFGVDSEQARAAEVSLEGARQSQVATLYRLAEAMVESQAAQAAQSGETLSADQKTMLLKQTLGELADTVGGPVRDELLKLTGTIHDIPGSKTVTITADASQAHSEISGLAARIAEIRNTSVSISASAAFHEAQLDEYSLGGWVKGPKGEPRLAVVHGGEHVATAEEMAAGGHPGGPGITAEEFGQAVAAAMTGMAVNLDGRRVGQVMENERRVYS